MGNTTGAVATLLRRYRATGADLPFGNPLPAHGVPMEGYFWRFTQPDTGQVIIALIGVNRAADGTWATLGLADLAGGFIRTDAHPDGWADPDGFGARAGDAFIADGNRVRVDLGPDARLDVRISEHAPWPHRLFGGSSYFQMVPRLNQYWHPCLLGGRADGTATLGGQTWRLDGAQVYVEKNWGPEGFPDAWWWGQAQGFAEPEACLAFAGGVINAGPLRTEVTALVVRLPDRTVLRLGNPVTSPVRARMTDTQRSLHGRNYLWQVDVEGTARHGEGHVLPVPLPSEHRNIAGDVEHLGGSVSVRVQRRGRLIWQGESHLAGLELGGLERAAQELRDRSAPPGAVDAPPAVRH